MKISTWLPKCGILHIPGLLQEDYNRLLTKYAEAENTIDRLRLEAKVCACVRMRQAFFFLHVWPHLTGTSSPVICHWVKAVKDNPNPWMSAFHFQVNLYSDPPRPSHPDCTGTLNMGSKVMIMTLPQAQRAQLDLNVVSTKTDPGKICHVYHDSASWGSLWFKSWRFPHCCLLQPLELRHTVYMHFFYL